MKPHGAKTAERGGAYLLALMVLLVITGLGIAISRIALIERRLGTTEEHRLQALSAAESGLELMTAQLVEELPTGATELWFSARRTASLTLESRCVLEAPVPLSEGGCRECGDESPGIGRASFLVAATGERRAGRLGSGVEGSRALASVSVQATATLQPWPLSGTTAPPPGPADDEPVCQPAAFERVRRRLIAEFHPEGCRFGARRREVGARDLESGALCVVEMAVCVLTTDRREG